MKYPELPANEKERLLALTEYDILDTLEEKDYDDITRLASEICQTPISLISLLDPTRQWFKSHHGLDVRETQRQYAFCAHAINTPEKVFVVPDATKDVRFADNPLVTGEPKVIFYTGVPLNTSKGFSIGTLCVIDHHPRELTDGQVQSLKALANQVIILLELRRKNIELDKKNAELNQFAYILSHDIKAPLSNIHTIAEIVKEDNADKLSKESNEHLEYLVKSTTKVKELVNGVLTYYRDDSNHVAEVIDLDELLHSITGLINIKQDVEFKYPQGKPTVFASKIALQQLFINLINNAIKYNDKETAVIEIGFVEEEELYRFSVKDNGRGIDPADLEKIFNLFTHLKKQDRDGNYGTGIGLATVKKLVNNLGGQILVESIPGQGSVFTFTVKKADKYPLGIAV